MDLTLDRWLAAINDHDVPAIKSLMAPEFVFVDSLGKRVVGASTMERGWQGYFTMCPDYWIHADHAMRDGNIMLLTGEAGGTIYGHEWKIPSAWKAIIREGQLVEWHVFADNKPVYEILAKRNV